MFARAFFELLPKLDIATLFRLTEPELIRILKQTAEGTDIQTLTDGLFGTRRRIHKRIAEFSVFNQEPLYRAMRQKPFSELAVISSKLAKELGHVAGLEIGRLDVLIDAPPQHREVEFNVQVYTASEKKYRPLRELSPIVDSMAKTQFDDCVKKVRIYGTEELRNALPENFDITTLMHKVLN